MFLLFSDGGSGERENVHHAANREVARNSFLVHKVLDGAEGNGRGQREGSSCFAFSQ